MRYWVVLVVVDAGAVGEWQWQGRWCGGLGLGATISGGVVVYRSWGHGV